MGLSRLFRFPTDEERRKKWAINCGRINWFPTDYTRICEAHFDESQFEQNRQDGKKLLKWNAVPTLFNNSIRQKRTIKRHFQKNRDSEDKASPEPINDREENIDSVNGTPETLEEVGKTTVKPRGRCKTQRMLSGHDQLEDIDEIALIKAVLEKMGHEVQSENCHIELNLQDEEKVTKVSVALPVVKKMKSPKRTLTVKQYPPKRRKLKEKTLLGPNSEAAEQSLRAHEKFRKSAEEACMSQGEAEDLEDELAQIKAEIKKLMHEANAEDSNVSEVQQPSGSQILKPADTPVTWNVSSLPPRVVSVKKRIQNRIPMEETTSSRSLILSSLSTKATVNGSCKGTVISENRQCLQVEVGIQTDNLEVVPRLKAEIELLKHQLAEKDKKIRQVEQRLAAILQPGQILLLRKFGSTLSGAKKYVVLGKEPNKAAAGKVS